MSTSTHINKSEMFTVKTEEHSTTLMREQESKSLKEWITTACKNHCFQNQIVCSWSPQQKGFSWPLAPLNERSPQWTLPQMNIRKKPLEYSLFCTQTMNEIGLKKKLWLDIYVEKKFLGEKICVIFHHPDNRNIAQQYANSHLTTWNIRVVQKSC